MKQFENPKIEVTKFSVEDILNTSGQSVGLFDEETERDVKQ